VLAHQSGEPPAVDGVAQRDVDLVGRAETDRRGESRVEHETRIAYRGNGGVLHAGGADGKGAGVGKGQMCVGFRHARHDELAAHIDLGGTVSRLGRCVRRSGIGNAITLDQQRAVVDDVFVQRGKQARIGVQRAGRHDGSSIGKKDFFALAVGAVFEVEV